ncbi:MAG: prephenate dehydrogenase [Anaerolineae bacterium]
MEPDFFSLSHARVAIVGLGLMGGSLALALRGHCAALLGIETDPTALALARRQKIVDYAESDPVKLLPQADLVILATPVSAILTLLDDLPRLMPNPCIVLDLGSTKSVIVEKMAILPERFDPLGGHPICGKETLGLQHADPGLYQAAPFILTPLPRTGERALLAARQVIAVIGAREVILDAALHDHYFAATSHLPFLLATALVLATPPEAVPFAGPGFRSTARLAGTPASMMLSVLQTNRENVLTALEALQSQLSLLHAALASNDLQDLARALAYAAGKYASISGG